MSPLVALAAHYKRLQARGALGPTSYTRESISLRTVLSVQGELLDVRDIRDTSGKQPRPRVLDVPAKVRRTSAVKANFLWDKTSYVFGIGRRLDGQVISAPKEWEAFRSLHLELLARAETEDLIALRRWLESLTAPPSSQAELRESLDLLNTSTVFSLEDSRRDLHETDEARKLWDKTRENGGARRAVCLVTGEQDVVLARLHRDIKGVSREAGVLSSWHAKSAQHLGRERGYTTPISARAAQEYAAALNHTLARKRLFLGDMTLTWWCEGPGEDLVETLLAPPTDEQEEARARDKLTAIRRGVPLRDIDPGLDPETRVFVLGLSQRRNVISRRYWAVDSLGALAVHLGQHFRDLRIEPGPRGFPGAGRLLRLMHRPGDRTGATPAPLALDVFRAIWEGTEYPSHLMTATLARLKIDPYGTPLEAVLHTERVSVLKACYIRAARLQAEREGREWKEAYMAMDREATDIAYCFGRLFACACYAEESIVRRNRSTFDRHYGAAMERPAETLPELEKRLAHSAARLRSTNGRAADRVEAERWEIYSLLPAAPLPDTFTDEQQCLFAIGFHHQTKWFWTRSVGEGAPEEPGAAD